MVGNRDFIIIAFVFFLTACASSKTSSNDDDPCAGRCGMVNETQCGSCKYGYTCNTAQYCVEITNDDIPIDETDHATDIDMVDCPSMKSYENVKAAGFPLKDGNGKITFCRPGCDTPTEKDPQCARNIWDWLNWGRYLKYKEGAESYSECYPWPCVLPDTKAQNIDYSPCDRDITNKYYHADMSVLYDLKIEKDKIGLVMVGSQASKTILYDIQSDTYTAIAHCGTGSVYKQERFIFYTTTEDYLTNGTYELGNTYILSAKNNTTGYRYEVIYDDEQHQAYFSRPPLVGDKWVVLNIEHRATKKQEVLYSKVDEWKWHPLKYGKVYEGNVVDNRLTFINDNHEIYVCDLDKLPFDPATECIRIDRAGETPSRPRLNEENNNQMIYFAGVGEYGITLVDTSGGTPTYTLIPIEPAEDNPMGMGPEQFKGNTILYIETFMPSGSSNQDYKACFYRIDKKKQYCPTTPSFKDGRYDMGFNSFDGNYQLWKTPAGTTSRFRDIACYCEKESICPFEGMK